MANTVWALLILSYIVVGLFVRGDTFPVCSRCNCSILPTTLDGRVVDVPASLEESSWFTFNESLTINETIVLIFRSVDQTANVEIKMKSINAPFPYIVYPAGRSDPTIATDDLGPLYYLCSRWTNYLTLGPSVVSTGPELAIVFVASWQFNVTVSLELLYRQHGPTMKTLKGIPLQEAPLNGSSVTVQLVTSFIGGAVPSRTGTTVIWSIPAMAANCSTEITFTGSTNNTFFSLNEANPAWIGVTHKLPQGNEAVITVGKRGSFDPVDALVNVKYRTVDCGLGDAFKTIQIQSWNGVVRPLTRPEMPVGGDPWHTVDFTFPNDGRQQAVIWFLSGDPASVAVTSWIQRWDTYIPALYMQEFSKEFGSSILPGTSPFVFFLDANVPMSTTFRYAFGPAVAPAPSVLVAIANSSTAMEMNITQSMITARSIHIKAANESCAVAVWRNSALPSQLRLLPFGLSSATSNDIFDIDYFTGEEAGILLNPLQSVGPIMGIQFFPWTDLNSVPPTVSYRMVCPTILRTSIPPGKWRYVYAPLGSFLLPRPPRHKGKQCRVDVSSASTGSILFRDRHMRLMVVCLQAPLRAQMLSDHMTTSMDHACEGTLQVDVYAQTRDVYFYAKNIPNTTPLFAYRVRCAGDAVGEHDGLAPFAPLKPFVAVNEWKTLAIGEYEYEAESSYTGSRGRENYMLQAKDPSCRVEVLVNEMYDITEITMFEGFESTDIGNPITELAGFATLRHLHYVSCDHRVFLVGFNDGLGSHLKYRQVCGDGKPGLGCFKNVTVEPSLDGKWQTLEGISNGNLNQLFNLHYRINVPRAGNSSSPRGQVLELEFTSLISAESWFGLAVAGRDSRYGPETHGIWLNQRFRATAGKQYLFKEAVDIKVDALARSKRGDQLFKVRYRLVDAKQATQEIRLGEVLIAAHTAKTLTFKFPPQFAQHRLKEIIQNGQFDPEHSDVDYYSYYAWSGDFPLWLFHQHYTIQPSKPSCRVALRFTQMSIGSGYVGGRLSHYNNQQHRLSVISGHPGTQSVPLTCDSDLIGGSRNRSVCARMDRTYMSAPGVALGVLFKSTDMSEYEYDNPEFWGNTHGPELTFGSGWTATYQQVCDAKKAEDLLTKLPMIVKAKPLRNANDWQRGLPGQLRDDKYRLFHDKRWLITASQTGCGVEYLLEAGKVFKMGLLPVLFQVGTAVVWPNVNQTFTSPNVTVIQLGANKANPVTIKYRQVCTSVPTASPTRHHGETGNNRDGQTCIYDGECASGVCSKTLQRCTANTCSAQCASKSNQASCISYAATGCSCQWSEIASNTCVPSV